MPSKLSFFPEQASTLAARVDGLYFFLIGVSAFFAVLIAVLVVSFAIKFRRRSEGDVPRPIHGSLALELTWTLIPFGLAMVMFFWGAQVYLAIARPPDDAMPVYVVAKQWMWKMQHLEGRREINELHVPINRPVKLIMTSEDVIHSFFVPAFRIKQDVLPNRYTTLWFQATKLGTYHLFCAEYCGTQHSGMIGHIVVQDPAEYEAWLGGASVTASLATAGENLFQQLGCVTCHRGDTGARGPALEGLWGTTVQLQGGATAVVDEAYVRESILTPQAKIVAGFQPIMPTFKGLVSEEGLLQLISYIKSLGPQTGETGAAAGHQG
ncbi:MAG TPA: cytochrome c oxidase subunit II [Candidatus Kryptonia bacterium]|nr:cytochrome c oxidase subunit II [Candidatus Kryptonia bacterium]